MDILSREITLTGKFLLPFSPWAILSGKNLPPKGANSFLLEKPPFLKGLINYWGWGGVGKQIPVCKKKKKESCFPLRNGGKISRCIHSP